MKKLFFALVVTLASTSSFAASNIWQSLRINGASQFTMWSGTTVSMPLPAVFDGRSPFAQLPFVKEFIVSIHPNSAKLGCETVSYGDVRTNNYTGVVKPYNGLPTQKVSSAESVQARRKGWMDHTYSVEGGRGAQVQNIVISLFSVGAPEANCVYELYFR